MTTSTPISSTLLEAQYRTVADDGNASSIDDPIAMGGSNDGSACIDVGDVVNHPSSGTPHTLIQVMDDGLGILPSPVVLVEARKRLQLSPPKLWGSFIRSSAVTMLVGETSAGKTVFLYNLAYHLATGEEFLGIKPQRCLSVLSLDFEGNDETRVTNMEAIGAAENWHIVVPLSELYDVPADKRGPELITRLGQAIKFHRYDLVIVDSLMEAYPVEDENSNDYANVQMVAFRRLAVQTGVAILVVHNSGLKSNDGGQSKKKGLARGASSRVDRADMVLNYTVKTDTERLLTVVKTRWNNLGEELRLRFCGDLGYEVVSSSAVPETTVEKVVLAILDVLERARAQGECSITRQELMNRLGIEDRTAMSQALDRALGGMLGSGIIVKVRKGVYSVPSCQVIDESSAA